MLLIAVAILFGGYILGHIPQFGSLLHDSILSGQSMEVPALNPAFYGMAGLVAFLLLLGILRSVGILLRRFRKASPLATRPGKPLAQFLEEAAAGKISGRVAREGYHLLEPHYPYPMCIDLTDRLREDLRLAEEEIRLLDAKLLTRFDRRDQPSRADAPDISSISTVFDLLLRVEAAASLRVERPSDARDKGATSSTPRPVREPRNSSSAQRKALHTAALMAIESRSLRSQEVSGLNRRSSDYEGPRRRVTDNRAAPTVFKGPYRRSSDHGTNPSTEVPSSLDRAELNGIDPAFVPPRAKRVPAPTTKS